MLALAVFLFPLGCESSQPAKSGFAFSKAAARIFVERPFQIIPEADPFILGVVTAFAEELVLAGYDYTGMSADPESEEELIERLRVVNQRIPGTAGVRLRFFEAPFGFSMAYSSVKCTVYSPNGEIVLFADFDPPVRRGLGKLLLPAKHPDVDGRQWGKRAWEKNLSALFPPRS